MKKYDDNYVLEMFLNDWTVDAAAADHIVEDLTDEQLKDIKHWIKQHESENLKVMTSIEESVNRYSAPMQTALKAIRSSDQELYRLWRS